MNPRLSAIRRALDYLEAHLQEDITVGEIAAAAGYSLYHFIRTFNEMVQHSPYDFLMRRRLTEAARELLASERKILEIALDFGFHNHETFSRAFKRMFQTSPSHWRSDRTVSDPVCLPALSDEYLIHINQVDFLPPTVVEDKNGLFVHFYHPAPADSLDLTLSYIHHTWLPQSGIELVFSPAAEHFIPEKDQIGLSADIPF